MMSNCYHITVLTLVIILDRYNIVIQEICCEYIDLLDNYP